MSLVPSGAIKPDAVFGPDDTEGQQVTELWQMLDPCPYCGAKQHDAPEGTNRNGDPHFNFPHCFKCGFRPTVDSGVGPDQQRKMYEQFQEWLSNQTAQDRQHPTLQPPQESQIAELQAQIQEMRDALAERNSPNVDLSPKPTVGEQTGSQPMSGADNPNTPESTTGG